MKVQTSLLRLSAVAALATISSGAFAQVPHWLQTYSAGPSSVETVVDMLCDTAGNVYTIGTTDGDVLVVSHTSAGVFRWANKYAGPGGGVDRPVEAVLDDIGNVVLVGEGSRTPTQSAFMALKFNGSSGALVWSQLYYETDPILGEVSGPAKGVVIGPGGFIYACGAIEVFNEFYDALAVRISPVTGAVVNTATYGLPVANSQIAEDIAWDGAGGLYVTGSTADNELPMSSDANDLLLVKYNGALGTIWTRTFDFIGRADYGRSVVCRRSLNSVYIMGNMTGSVPGFPHIVLEVFVIRVNSISGGEVWRNNQRIWQYPAVSDLRRGEMVLDRFGYLRVVSYFDPTCVAVMRCTSTNGAMTAPRWHNGRNFSLIADVSSNIIVAGEGIAKYGADGFLRWVSSEPAAAATVNQTGVIYSAGVVAGDMKITRWNQAAYSLTITPDPPLGGTIITGTVHSALPAPAGGLTFNFGLRPDLFYLLPVPPPVTIPAGKTFVNFPMRLPPLGDDDFELTAYLNEAGTSKTIVIRPPSLKSLTVTPTTIKGGGIAVGTMKMDSILRFGFVFDPTSNSPFCTVDRGTIMSNSATSKPFNVRTMAVTAVTPVTLSLTVWGVTKTALLTITP